MRKGLRLLALTAAACVCLCGCAPRVREGDAAREITLPQPTQEAQSMFLGEQLTQMTADVALYFPASDGVGFSVVNRTIRAEAGTGMIRAAVNALLSTANGATMAFPVADVRVLSCEYACGIATVRLSLDARGAQSPQELLAVETAVGNTLLGIEGVSGVNVLIGDESEGFGQLPLGVQTGIQPSVTASYAQLQAERDRLLSGDPSPILRNAVLYFPANGANWLVPELREVTLTSADFAGALIEALKQGPAQEACAVASLPDVSDLMKGTPSVETLSTGERVLSLNFSSALANYLAFSGLEVWKLVGSVSMTMCSFLPEVDAVRVMVNDEPITILEIGDSIVSFPGGLIRRADFADSIGGVATLYLANESGALQAVERAVSSRSAYSPRSLMIELFSFAGRESAPRLPVPGSVYPEDLLGLRVVDGVAQVNLSSDFYRACQSLDAVDERNLVYAIVNTLCRLDAIRGVRFFVEGVAADTLAGGIYLRSVLLPNPGIIAEDPATAEARYAAPTASD